METNRKYKKYLNKMNAKELFKDKHNIVLILILLFAFITRMYFFFYTIDQPVWWDESQYIEQAKRLGLDLETNDIWYYRRTMLLSVFWSFFYKIGLGEITLRFTEVLFSMLLVYATFLVGKEMFNRKIGLLAAFGVAISRIILFETSRLLTSVPSAALMMLAVYFSKIFLSLLLNKLFQKKKLKERKQILYLMQ